MSKVPCEIIQLNSKEIKLKPISTLTSNSEYRVVLTEGVTSVLKSKLIGSTFLFTTSKGYVDGDDMFISSFKAQPINPGSNPNVDGDDMFISSFKYQHPFQSSIGVLLGSLV